MSAIIELARRIRSVPWVKRLCSGTFRPTPVAPWEVLIMRVLFACVVWQTMPENFHYAEQKYPNGIARWYDLTWLWSGHEYSLAWMGVENPVSAMQIIRVVVAISLLFYAAGFLLSISLPLITAASVIVRTYYNSQGSIHHGCQMVTIILVFQTIVVLWFAGRRLYGRLSAKPFRFPEGLSQWSYFLYYSQGAIAGCYVIAGLTKIVRTGGTWFWNSPYMALEVIKTEKQEFYSTLDHSVLGTQTVYAEWMLNYPYLTRLFLSGGVFLELFAIMALFSRNTALMIGAGMILFHRSVDIVMNLHFRFNEYAVWIFCINLPFWAALAMRNARARRSTQGLRINTGREHGK